MSTCDFVQRFRIKEDVWSRSSGQTRSTINFARATYNALEELSKTKVSDQVGERLHITIGRRNA